MRRYPSQKQQQPYGDTIITNSDGLESYALKNIIGKGSSSIVHLATCTRGRLRGRDVALKLVPRALSTPAFESMRIATTALHKSMHHPAILALHSSFTNTDYHCLVLELCPGGTLWDFLHSQSGISPAGQVPEPLRPSEAQLRPILRSIIEGLSHLHERGIIHRNLSVRSIFLTAEGRAKLGRFGRASLIHMMSNSADGNHAGISEDGSLKKRSIEHKHSVQGDLWSLGCLIRLLLAGTPSSDGETVFTPPSPGPSTRPTSLKCSKEAGALITTLLTHIPDTHVQPTLKDILSLPFFHPTTKAQPLNSSTSNPSNTSQGVTQYIRPGPVYFDLQSLKKKQNHEDDGTAHQEKVIPCLIETVKPTPDLLLSKESNYIPTSRLASESSTAPSGIRGSWAKLTARQKPNVRRDALSATVNPPENNARAGTRKAKRDPLAEVGNHGQPSTLDDVRVEDQKNHILVSGLFSPPGTQCRSTPPPKEPDTIHPVLAPQPVDPPSPRPSGPAIASRNNIPSSRTNTPTAFKVSPLFPQTHKLAQGQLVVLPSRSLLVDLREGERRAGGRGECVICIDADGQQISVYEAPHLSTPCILSEPVAKWTLSTLPPRYWDTYSFAGNFVESIKKRTPWMVWYTAEAKFTLMSNVPQGDVHAAIPCPLPGGRKHRRSGVGTAARTRMRIVLSRTRGTVEVTRFTGSEWVTKVGTYPAATNEMNLTTEEQVALKSTLAALKVCEAAEAQCVDAGSTEKELPELEKDCDKLKDAEERATEISRNLKGLPLAIAPRPRRISSAIPSHSTSATRSNSLYEVSGPP